MELTDLTATAEEVEGLFRRMAESSVVALDSLKRNDTGAAILAIEERDALTQRVEALMPGLLRERTREADQVNELLAAVRMAAEAVRTADVQLSGELRGRRTELAGQIETIDERSGANSAYSKVSSSRRAYINVVR